MLRNLGRRGLSIRKALLAVLVSLIGDVALAQFSAVKVYTITNYNNANMFIQDIGGSVAVGNSTGNVYWKFVATRNPDCYYIQNATTGKYIQGYSGSEQEVATGDTGVEYYVKADANGTYQGKFRMSCTANSPHDFSSGTWGLNWKNNDKVQSFTSVANANPRSAWNIEEGDVVYTIESKVGATNYMQDNGSDLQVKAINNNSYWLLEESGNADCYYVRNAMTGRYIQSTQTREESIQMGKDRKEICVKYCSNEDAYGLASTDQNDWSFSAQTIGANHKDSGEGIVQGYDAQAGTNHRSFWKISWIPRNKWLLSCTIAIAEAEGVDVTSARTALKNNNGIDDALAALRIDRKRYHAETQEIDFESALPEAGGSYYLYNVGEQKFFCGGAESGTHAALGFPGIEITLEDAGDGDGAFKINTHLQNGFDNENPKQYLKYNDYCDTWTTDEFWKFEALEGGKYNIVRSQDARKILGYNGGTYDKVISTCSTKAQTSNQWKLVTKAQRDALLAAATEVSPIDASYLIKMPNFSQREYNETGGWDTGKNRAWTHVKGQIWERDRSHTDYVFECWNESSLDLNQTIAGLTPGGRYKVIFNGYYRDGSRDSHVETLDGGGTPAQLAKLYLNDVEAATLPRIDSEKDKVPGIGTLTTIGTLPDKCDIATEYFQAGLYKVESAVVTVGVDGNLTISIRKSGGKDEDWVVVDNFRLLYYGEVKNIPLNYDYATFSAAQAYRIDTEGVSAYKVTEGATANEVNLVELTDGIPANTGVVLYGAGKESVQLTAVDGSTSDVSGNLMKPNVSDYNLPTSIVIDATTYNNYTLGYHNDEVKFLRSSGEGTLAAGKAYLQLPATAASRVNIVFFEEGTTDIHSTKDTQRITNSEMYDLQGRRIGNMKANSQLKKGLYIVRSAKGHLQGKKGQKVVVK